MRGHPFERPPPLERPLDNVNLNIKCIKFYPWWEATPLERPLFWCKRGGLTRGVLLYTCFISKISFHLIRYLCLRSSRHFSRCTSPAATMTCSPVSCVTICTDGSAWFRSRRPRMRVVMSPEIRSKVASSQRIRWAGCSKAWPCRVGSVGSVSASHTVGSEFASRPGHTKDHHKNGTNCLPAWHAMR